VVLHARSEQRAADARSSIPGAEAVVIGDCRASEATRDVARQVNRLGAFDAVIHNAGIGYRESRRVATADGLPNVFAINSLASLYSDRADKQAEAARVSPVPEMHHGVDPQLDDLAWTHVWSGARAYAESKLHDVILALPWRASGRMFCPTRWSQVGCLQKWADGAPRMTSMRAPGRRCGSLPATSAPPKSRAGYFYHLKPRKPDPAATDRSIQIVSGGMRPPLGSTLSRLMQPGPTSA